MHVTFILKDKTDHFFDKLEAMNHTEKFAYLNGKARHELAIPMKIATGQFRDAVELNSIVKGPHAIAYTLELRKGYRLAIFEIIKA